jgi:hypothetical protein
MYLAADLSQALFEWCSLNAIGIDADYVSQQKSTFLERHFLGGAMMAGGWTIGQKLLLGKFL